jgi:hypothetical protein
VRALRKGTFRSAEAERRALPHNGREEHTVTLATASRCGLWPAEAERNQVSRPVDCNECINWDSCHVCGESP